MSLKLISLNIEHDKHFDRFLPFLETEQPDVVCFQELFLLDIPLIQQQLQMNFMFVPKHIFDQETKYKISQRGIAGVGIFTRLPYRSGQVEPYGGDSSRLASFHQPLDSTHSLLSMVVEKAGATYCVATTHFTWSPNGLPNPEQRQHAQKFKQVLQSFPELILCGDMNAPRGGEIFKQLGDGFVDAIPPEVTTTLDSEFHYAGPLELVVDVLFHTKQYHAKSVQVIGGVSDHKAVVAVIERT